MKRNLIHEITDIRSRVEFNSRHEFSARLDNIEYAFNQSNMGEHNQELLKYIPIATVACFEAFFRSVIAELVDFGEPYAGNVVRFNQSKNVKFDFDIVNAIQSRAVTMGEFISHILPCNNYEDINANISTITGLDFTKAIKEHRRESIFEEITINSNTFVQNFSQIMADIKRTFELRHIFCHEFATTVEVNKDEIYRCVFHAKVFLNQTNDFIWHLLYPDVQETQAGMNVNTHDEFQAADQELEQLLSQINEAAKHATDMFRIDVDLLNESMETWRNYHTTRAKLSGSVVAGGSMYGMIYAGSLTRTTKEKIESLRKEYDYQLRKLSGA